MVECVTCKSILCGCFCGLTLVVHCVICWSIRFLCGMVVHYCVFHGPVPVLIILFHGPVPAIYCAVSRFISCGLSSNFTVQFLWFIV